jgi:hypothetical protein
VYVKIHEDSEHRTTKRAGCAVDLFTSSQASNGQSRTLKLDLRAQFGDAINGEPDGNVLLDAGFVDVSINASLPKGKLKRPPSAPPCVNSSYLLWSAQSSKAVHTSMQTKTVSTLAFRFF